MPSSVVRLPNGQAITVTPVFGGVSFKSSNLNTHNAAFPPGWTVVLQTEDDGARGAWGEHAELVAAGSRDSFPTKRRNIHPFKSPTLSDDYLFISSISNPSNAEFKPANSPTRQIAMMLWATLYWYFHQPAPDPRLTTPASSKTADSGKPKGEWRVNIRREGVLRGRLLLQKLERMGLAASEDSSVGLRHDERSGDGFQDMFMSRRAFWQLDPRLFLFTLEPTSHSPHTSGSPYPSRPSSPCANLSTDVRADSQSEPTPSLTSQGLWTPSGPGPFTSASHLPTYFPPPPLQYTFTNQTRHPIRPKPPRQGETFYARFIPGLDQYLSFRLASLSTKDPGSVGPQSPSQASFLVPSYASSQEAQVISPSAVYDGQGDVDRLHRWMNDPRVAKFWGVAGPGTVQEDFLRSGLQSRHSFPVIGCWDGRPFGYVEIYWVREDILGRHLDNGGDAWDRGIHCLVGEQEFRGRHRFRVWMSALVHYCFLADNRTQSVVMEPRVDNDKWVQKLLVRYTADEGCDYRIIGYLQELGFFKEKEVSFPHKQAALMRLKREAWEGPCL